VIACLAKGLSALRWYAARPVEHLFPAAIQFNSEFETGCSATAPSFA